MENPGPQALGLYITGFASNKESHPLGINMFIKIRKLQRVFPGDYSRAPKGTGEKHCTFRAEEGAGGADFILPADVGMFPVCLSRSPAVQGRVLVCLGHLIKCDLMAQKE